MATGTPLNDATKTAQLVTRRNFQAVAKLATSSKLLM